MGLLTFIKGLTAFFLFINYLVSSVAVFAQTGLDIVAVPGARHEVGYACLEEVNFRKYGEELFCQQYSGGAWPSWARREKGETLTPEGGATLKQAMFDYEEWGFAVYGASEKEVELRSGAHEGALSVWVPKSKIKSFKPIYELNFCGFEHPAGTWYLNLYKEDLKARESFNFPETIPKNPFHGLDALGVLKISKDASRRICDKDICYPPEIQVDPNLFQVPDSGPADGSRPIEPPQSLDLSWSHFYGTTQMVREPPVEISGWTDYLFYYGRRGETEFLLQSTVYNAPRLWVQLPENIVQSIEVFSEAEARKKLPKSVLEPEGGRHFPGPFEFRDEFLRRPSVEHSSDSHSRRWSDGQLWLKVRVDFFSQSMEQDRLHWGQYFFGSEENVRKSTSRKFLGNFWVPYPQLAVCAKGF